MQERLLPYVGNTIRSCFHHSSQLFESAEIHFRQQRTKLLLCLIINPSVGTRKNIPSARKTLNIQGRVSTSKTAQRFMSRNNHIERRYMKKTLFKDTTGKTHGAIGVPINVRSRSRSVTRIRCEILPTRQESEGSISSARQIFIRTPGYELRDWSATAFGRRTDVLNVQHPDGQTGRLGFCGQSSNFAGVQWRCWSRMIARHLRNPIKHRRDQIIHRACFF